MNVWILDIGEWVEQRFLHLLSAEEKKQAGAFKFRDDTLRYIASRGLARTVIAHTLNQGDFSLQLSQGDQSLQLDGQSLQHGQSIQFDGRSLQHGQSLQQELDGRELMFAEGPFGKPSLPDFPDFHFNSSHAGGKVVIATSRHPVGVDIESTSNCRLINSDLEKVLLSQSQLDQLDQSNSPDRKREVLRLWVHKEAYLKAIGTGLSISPKEIELVEKASGSFQIVTPKEHSGGADDLAWYSRELELQQGTISPEATEGQFVGAVVSQGFDWSVNYFDFVAVLGNARV